jgi:cytochrome c556
VHLSVKNVASAGALAAVLLVGGVQEVAAQQADPAIVTLRKSLMVSNQQHIAALRALLSGDVNLPLHILKHTAALQANGEMLGQLFPEGSMHASSRAVEAIWSDSEGFTQRVRAFADATRNLNAVAQRGFNDQTVEALSAIGPTCGGCHGTFRGPAQGN